MVLESEQWNLQHKGNWLKALKSTRLNCRPSRLGMRGAQGGREGGRRGVVRKPSGTETILFWFLLVNGILHRSETSYKTQAPTVHKAQENVRKRGKVKAA